MSDAPPGLKEQSVPEKTPVAAGVGAGAGLPTPPHSNSAAASTTAGSEQPVEQGVYAGHSPTSPTPESHANDESQDPSNPEALARQLFDGVGHVPHYESAAWLGAAERSDVRKAYMNLFDWTGLSVLAALRALCTKLYMKAESQHLDRIIDAFSDHWVECNPTHGFRSPGIVYALSYSMLLLNTDLHSEEYSGSKKMPRGQYVQQTLETVRSLLKAEAAEREGRAESQYHTAGSGASRRSNSFDSQRPSVTSKRWSANFSVPSSSSGTSARLDNTALVSDLTPYSAKEWEGIIGGLLKSIYSSIDMYPLALSKGSDSDPRLAGNELSGRTSMDFRGGANSVFLHPQSSAASLSGPYGSGGAGSGAAAGRNNSLLSKFTFNRRASYNDTWSDYEYQGIIAQNTNPHYAHSSHGAPLGKRRSLYGASSFSGASASASALQSPATETSPSVGFAGALRNSIIREEQAAHIHANSDMMSIADSVNSLQMADTASIATSVAGSMMPETIQEEELELSGPPWAKEGLLKYQVGGDGKKYKKKDTWVQVFCVVGKGYLRVFRFDTGGGSGGGGTSLHKRSQRAHGHGHSHGHGLQPRASVSDLGGGNWLDQAVMTDNVSLAHTLAQVVPNKDDGDATSWSLSLPGDRVLVFRAGTDDIANEYVYSCNYWAARVSKEPLVEAVSSAEYGWHRPVELSMEAERAGRRPKVAAASFDTIVIDTTRIQIREWRPRVPSTVHSSLDEDMQLESLRRHVSNVERILAEHNSHRGHMINIFQPGHVVSTRAHSNWEKRSQYLLRETVMYETYIQMLERAMKDREAVNDAKADNPQ